MGKAVKLSVLFIIVLISGCSKESDPGGNFNSYKDYVVLAWNDLGMHCLNPSFTQAVILPPYNTIMAQVIRRGDPPQVITSGIQVEYRIVDNTYSYGKADFGSFWDNSLKLFGVTVPKDIGLTGNGLQGYMATEGDHFIASGTPVTPIKDDGTWTPFQVGEITVKDMSGNVLITTRCTVPVSDEIHCDGCHLPGAQNNNNAFIDVLQKHDMKHMSVAGNLESAAPVLCAGCHGAPELGTSGPGSAGKYLSAAIHGAHASRNYPNGSPITCYSCHPGNQTQCSRSLRHMGTDGNCVTCHGDMANVASTINSGTRIPWVKEPTCVTCHTGTDGVNTDTLLYRNARGHGQVYCAGCHGSPHAMYPAREASDNYQPNQYQPSAARVKTLGSCGACHDNSRGAGGDAGEYSEQHGGTSPSTSNGCNLCHTNVHTNTAQWPHAYTWKNSNAK
jgi:hypothetical protein